MFVPHHVLVTGDGATPARWMLVLHGIYGSGANWRTFARKLVGQRPDWGMVLVDLRMHGSSLAAPPPHTVQAAAQDLDRLAGELAGRGHRVEAVCGHSFGGKVALAYRASQKERSDEQLAQTWVIDSSPSARPGAMDEPDNIVANVLAMLTDLPASFASRNEFVTTVRERGFPDAIGHWLAMNLERGPGTDGGYRSRLDPGAMNTLLRDYHALDGWPMLSDGPGRVHVVVAGKSNSLLAADRARLAELAARHDSIDVTTIESSGHWVHIEAPDALLETIASGLPVTP